MIRILTIKIFREASPLRRPNTRERGKGKAQGVVSRRWIRLNALVDGGEYTMNT